MARREVALLGGGCFWCLDAVYRGVEGVLESVSGYAGGHVENPTYEEVCGKKTGHVEVVQLTFDPDVVSYADLLRIFFTIHDPTSMDRQGADVGPQYRSAIYAMDESQVDTAKAVMKEAADWWDGEIVTHLIHPAPKFWEAEPVHQNYFARNPWAGYCMAVVAPKVVKARKNFSRLMRAA
ncbi:peptide-methionine (S)-S-oxide reductase MsrA [Acetobacteraceae bacterium H6797]|nr:peptide-methionine (S)-S-oxide reductase MsrA [Acetobacteraceae bacterium H6797]